MTRGGKEADLELVYMEDSSGLTFKFDLFHFTPKVNYSISY